MAATIPQDEDGREELTQWFCGQKTQTKLGWDWAQDSQYGQNEKNLINKYKSIGIYVYQSIKHFHII